MTAAVSFIGLQPAPMRRRVIALGNFDGVHLGHCRLLDATARLARPLGAQPCVLTFSPHPRRFFQPDTPPSALTTCEEKRALIGARGVDDVLTLRFDQALAACSAQAFVQDILVGQLGAAHVVVGEDYRFGQGRRGDVALLRQMGAQLGFGVHVEAAALDRHQAVCSSSRVRAFLAEGEVALAADILGRPWTTHAEVTQVTETQIELALRQYQHLAPGFYGVRLGRSPTRAHGVKATARVAQDGTTLAIDRPMAIDPSSPLRIEWLSRASTARRQRPSPSKPDQAQGSAHV